MRKFFSYNYLPFLMAPDTEGAGGSADNTNGNGGSGDTNTNTNTNTDNGTSGTDSGADNGDKGGKGTDTKEPSVEDLIAAAVAKEVEGLKRKRDELLEDNKKLKDQVKKTPQITEDEYKLLRDMQERIQRDELLKLMAEGKSEEAIAKATARTKAELEAQITAEREARERAAQEAASAKAELENTKKAIAITSAAAPVVKPQYQDLVSKLIDDQVKVIDGQVRVVNAAGEVVEKAGKPITVTDLVETLRPTYADLFLATSGGGASGSDNKSRGKGSITMDMMADMDPGEYMRLRNDGKF